MPNQKYVSNRLLQADIVVVWHEYLLDMVRGRKAAIINKICYAINKEEGGLRIVMGMLPFEFCCGQHYLSVLFVVRRSEQIVRRVRGIYVAVIRFFREIQYVVKVKTENNYPNYLG